MKPKNPLKLDGATPLPEKALRALDHIEPSRRDFLKTAGVMMIGFGVGAAAATTAEAQSPINPSGNVDATQVDNWVAVGADESITVFAGKAELGTGMRTVQLQLAAEELSVPLDRITLVLCRSGVTPNQGLTVGSLSTMTQFGTGGLRVALDTARDALYQLASLWLDVPASQLSLKDGVFSINGGDPTLTVSYGQLVEGRRFNLPVNPKATPNDPTTWKVIGQPIPRVDIPSKAKGTFQYVHKVRVPGMLHGRVVRPPALGAHVQNIDNNVLNGLPGNPQVVRVNDFVGVVANTEWNAIKAAAALASGVTWSGGDVLPAQADLYMFMTQQPSRNSFSVNTGDVDQVMTSAAQTISAQYHYPYQMHGALASSCAVADVRGGTGPTASVRVWSATQGVYNMRTVLSNLLSIPQPNIEVIFVDGSGCYGHNGADPVTHDASLLSQAVGRPVRVQYSRRDEMTGGEHYGHPMVSNEKVGLDANGTIIAWDYENVLMQHGEGAAIGNLPGNGIPGALAGFPTAKVVPTTTPPPNPTSYSNFSNAVPSYVTGSINGVSFGTGIVTSQRVLNRVVESPLWTAWLRSPDRLQNTFAHESFMDEIAGSLQVDPIQYRLRHLSDQRLVNVINLVAQKAGWDTRPSPAAAMFRIFFPPGVATGRGFSCVLYEGLDGYCAMVAEVNVDLNTGIITVTKVTAGIDTGPVVNPDGLRNQMEGQVVQGISRTLVEEVLFDRASSTITSKDWVSYPVLKFGDVLPEIDTVLINNLNVPPTGAGETTITIVAAAIGNAVYDATGVRMRQVPFTPENFLAAKAAQKK
jgi:CO/xanthine dehydrogenase Mo-binding subunit